MINTSIAHLDQKAKTEIAKFVAAWPIFGGEDPPAGAPTTGGPTGAPPAGKPADPIVALQSDPVALAQLVNQSQTLQQQVTQMTSQLTDATTKLQTFEQQKADAENATKTKEEQLTTENQKLQQELERRDNIIAQKTLENAIIQNTKYEFHSVKDIIANLDQNVIELNIDVDKQIAEVKGLDAELDRIATADSWRVSKNKTVPEGTPPAGTPPAPPARPSGGAPRPPAAPNDKATQRAAAIKRFPSLAAAGIKA